MSKKVKEEVNMTNQHILELRKKYKLPKDLKTVEYSCGFGYLPYCHMYVWVEVDRLCFLADLPEPKQMMIPMADFDGYSKQGSIIREEYMRQTRAPLESMMLNMFKTVFTGTQYQRATDIFVDDQRMTVLEIMINGTLSYIFFEGHDLFHQLQSEIPEKELR